jgi:hypothetical protein
VLTIDADFKRSTIAAHHSSPRGSRWSLRTALGRPLSRSLRCGYRHLVNDYQGKPVLSLDSSRRISGVAEYGPFGEVNTRYLGSESAQPYPNNLQQTLSSWTQDSAGEDGGDLPTALRRVPEAWCWWPPARKSPRRESLRLMQDRLQATWLLALEHPRPRRQGACWNLEVSRMNTDARKGPAQEPSLSDPAWRAFVLEWEQLTDVVDGDWRALRRGFRRLKAKTKSAKAVPADAVDQHLNYSVFDLAVRWEVSPRIVRAAFSQVWSGGCATHLRIAAAAHFFAWACRVSPSDVPQAQDAALKAKQLTLEVEDPLKRLNLERMLQVLTDPCGRGPRAR